MNNSYIRLYSETHRLNEYKSIIQNTPDKFPIICLMDGSIKEYYKLLMSGNQTIMHILNIIRRRTLLKPEEALMCFTTNNKVQSPTKIISKVYSVHKNTDGFLYLIFCKENCFGRGKK